MPPTLWQGDIARSYFYLSLAYIDKWECCDEPGVNGSSIKPWMETMLRQWHEDDPVSEHELYVNRLVFGIQENRSPFVDHPEWVKLIKDF